MKRLLIFLMAFSLFTACNNNKGKFPIGDKKSDYRDKDDYNTNDGDDNKPKKNNENEDSDNGGWSSKDKNKFFAECMTGFDGNEDLGKKICPCALEKYEKRYSSYSEVQEKNDEAEGRKIGAQCKQELDGNSNNDDNVNNDNNNSSGWTRSDENKFVDACAGTASKNVGEERANQYCNCMLKKMKKEYSSYAEAERALNRMSKEEINNIAADCN